RVAGAASGLATLFEKLPGPVKSVAVGLAGVVAVAGPLLFVGGKIVSTYGQVVRLMSTGGRGITAGVASIGKTSEMTADQVGGLSTKMSGFAKAATAGTIAVAGLAAAWEMWNSE